jgi:protein-S-isoprenylcysteine O-methyltransferase
MIQPYWLALFYGLSEVAISMFLRSKTQSSGTDRGSLRLIWIVINISVIAAIYSWLHLRSASFGGGEVLYWTGFVCFGAGIALRWYSIYRLGRFFTVDVTVRPDQTVIDSGPYKLIRHPSYAGSVLAFFGLGLCFANYVTLLLLVVPPTAVFFHRIRIEEAALLAGLGEPYRRYMQRTRRLIPFLY